MRAVIFITMHSHRSRRAPEKYGGSSSDLSSLNNLSSNGYEDECSNNSDSSDSSSSIDDSESYDTESSEEEQGHV